MGFQSTLPQGERRFTSCINASAIFISIHAPTRGATLERAVRHVYRNDFNPRSHKGSDFVDDYIFQRLWTFQSTLPQGERRFGRDSALTRNQFQSTLPQGERLEDVVDAEEISQFQSTLPQGERPRQKWYRRCPRYFNPRSHKGSDSNFTQNSISVLFHFYQSFPHIIFPHTARFRLLIIFCTFFLVRIAQRFPVCFHFAPKQYPAFYNVCSTDLL